MSTLDGKRILITQSALVKFAGSEIVTLELAEELLCLGATVKVFTWEYKDPIKKEFEKRKISVTLNEEDSYFDDLDYIWCHHQVIPEKIIKKIHKDEKYRPIFIFNHMSGLETNYIEQPYISGLENKLSSLSLFNSEETKEMNIRLFPDSYRGIDLGLFTNPAPREFINNKRIPEELERVLVVSNHSVKELELLKDKKKRFRVDYLGEISNTKELLGIGRLSRYDAIITMGKTVQYCLVSGIPVYLYGKFGGCGYLNGGNFDKNALVNFSGRNNEKKTAERIIKEIEDGFLGALKYQRNKRKEFIRKYGLPSALKDIFIVAARKDYGLSPEEKQIVLASMAASKWKLKGDYYVSELVEIMQERDKQVAVLEYSNKQLSRDVSIMKKTGLYSVVRIIKWITRKTKKS